MCRLIGVWALHSGWAAACAPGLVVHLAAPQMDRKDIILADRCDGSMHSGEEG